jgi:hypothetical protein
MINKEAISILQAIASKEGRAVQNSSNTTNANHFDTVSKRSPFEWISLITGKGNHAVCAVTLACLQKSKH